MSRTEPLTPERINQEAARIGADVAAKWADDVDRDARFPSEAIADLRAAGVLGALVPSQWGGPGASVREAGEGVTSVARHCASTGLILAMHHIQVAILAAHASDSARDLLLPRVAAGELLIANANSEVGLGGERRTSRCALEPTGDGFHLEKDASTVSYGEYADAITATARRSPESAPNDQSLAICVRPAMSLTSTGEWDTLGLRGTCSRPGKLVADVPADLVIADYSDVFVRTSLGASLVLLSSVWLGIAEAAAAKAHSSVRAKARKNLIPAQGGQPDQTASMSAFRLVELTTVLYQFRDSVAMAAADYERRIGTPEVENLGFLARLDAVKVASSAHVVDIALRAMAICGLPSYQNGSPLSLSRLVRDALAAPLMINNDRATQASAQTILLRKEL